ncbi:MAG: hypothetical protein O4859_19915 [Trichodesmium sp. St18_bin1]|jgi:hypothetical protein|nr:hypothetical protein [Trichodesmium sp. St18_bin1]
MESSGDGQIAGLFILALATLLNRKIPNLLLFEIAPLPRRWYCGGDRGTRGK